MIQEKIEIIRDKFKNASIETLPELMTTYREDGRIGVGKILERAQKKLDAYNKELDRVQKMLSYERQYGECGVICGIDEAGRGPLAGPVVAGAVVGALMETLAFSVLTVSIRSVSVPSGV